MVDFERDINLIKAGHALIYQNIVGLKSDLSGPKLLPELLAQDSEEDSSEEGGSSGSEEGEDGGGSKFVNSARPRNETAEDKKVSKEYKFIEIIVGHQGISNAIFFTALEVV